MDVSSRTIYIENFPLNTSENTLSKLFKNFGKIKRIDVPTFEPQHPLCRGLPKPKAKGYATIEFTSKDAAEKALEFFNDLNYITQIFDDKASESTKNGDEQPDSLLRNKIVNNLEFKNLLLLRVMSFRTFQDLKERYNEQRFQSLVRAAKLLIIA